MPVWTQSLKMHLNGGTKFSSIVYNILADGKPTGITRTKRTSGSPKYLIELDRFESSNGYEFDMMKTMGVGLMAWLEERWAEIEEPKTIAPEKAT